MDLPLLTNVCVVTSLEAWPGAWWILPRNSERPGTCETVPRWSAPAKRAASVHGGDPGQMAAGKPSGYSSRPRPWPKNWTTWHATQGHAPGMECGRAASERAPSLRHRRGLRFWRTDWRDAMLGWCWSPTILQRGLKTALAVEAGHTVLRRGRINRGVLAGWRRASHQRWESSTAVQVIGDLVA
jgi:hypothetical protein